MESSKVYSVKVYLMRQGCVEPEIRRFSLARHSIESYAGFTQKIMMQFPDVAGKLFSIYWKDEEDDLIIITDYEDILTAMETMEGNIKKFYIKVKSLERQESPGVEEVHPMVYCDGCNSDIPGFRYKCIVCLDYDLCRDCERAGVHPEHPMLRIPSPFTFDRSELLKVTRLFSFMLSSGKAEGGRHSHHHHQRRKHSHDYGYPDFCKKKRKSDKHESGQEAEESDDGGHRKHSYKKWKKSNKCLYGLLMNGLLDPSKFATEETKKSENEKKTNEGASEEPSHLMYLNSIGGTIAQLLEPLGINVDFEIRPKSENEEKKKKEEPSSGATSAPAPSAPPQQKEVKFAETPEEKKETMKQKIEEITKILANQTNISGENDGWVDFEELKRDSESTVPEVSTSTEAPAKMPQTQATTSQGEHKNSSSWPQGQEPSNLYPKLTEPKLPSNPRVRVALEKMLAMGFTNDGEWLTHLLEAKNGDINLALEVLAPHKK